MVRRRLVAGVPVLSAFAAFVALAGCASPAPTAVTTPDDAGIGSGSSSGGHSSSGSSSGTNGSSSGTTSGSSSGTNGSSSGTTSSSSSGFHRLLLRFHVAAPSLGNPPVRARGGTASCGCNGAAGCAVWTNMYVSWYGFNDNSCATEGQTGCNDIAYGSPVSTAGNYGTPYPNAGNIKHTVATEGTGTYDDPITAASSADSDPQNVTSGNPRHQFESSGRTTTAPPPGRSSTTPKCRSTSSWKTPASSAATNTPASPRRRTAPTRASPPAACRGATCTSTSGWAPRRAPTRTTSTALRGQFEHRFCLSPGGQTALIINPPPNLPVVTTPLYTGSGAGGGCWTSNQVPSSSCQ